MFFKRMGQPDMDNVVTVHLPSPAYYKQGMGAYPWGSSTRDVEAGFPLLLGEFEVSLKT